MLCYFALEVDDALLEREGLRLVGGDLRLVGGDLRRGPRRRDGGFVVDVILREVSEGIEVSAVDPLASMSAIDNDELKQVAGKVRDMLSEVVESI